MRPVAPSIFRCACFTARPITALRWCDHLGTTPVASARWASACSTTSQRRRMPCGQRRPGGHRRFRCPSRQRHRADLKRQSRHPVRQHAPVPVLSRDGCRGRRSGCALDGTTVNIPLPQGSAGEEYRLIFAKIVVPVLRFAPDIILVSAGFDAHARDPLAGMSLVEEDYANMVRTLLSCSRGWP